MQVDSDPSSVTSDQESVFDVETPAYMADSSGENIVSPGMEEVEQKSAFGEVTTAQYIIPRTRGYSTSTIRADRTPQAKISSGDWNSKRDAIKESTTSTFGVMVPALRMQIKASSGIGPRGKSFATDREPKSDVSSRSFDEPQFEEVAEELSRPSEGW